MDLMSGGDGDRLDVGTLGSTGTQPAGWMPARVRFHRGGTLTYRLAPQELRGCLELLVLPTDGPVGVYDVLGARVRALRRGHSRSRVSRSTASTRPGRGVWRQPIQVCWGVERRTSQVPVPSEPWGGNHVHGVGDVVPGARCDDPGGRVRRAAFTLP
jgi:hypothetical protein